MENEKKCDIYKFLVDNFCLQYYLVKPIPKLYKKCISKIRLSSHNLLIETGRHKNIPRDQRFCPMCKLQFGQNSDIEDEYHFILICPTYRDLRKKFIKKYYWSNPSVYKFVQLLSANNVRDLCNLGKYIKKAFEKRSVNI